MKKSLITLALLAITTVVSFGQGTINPLNASTSRVKIDSNRNGIVDSTDANAMSTDGIIVGVFFGPGGGNVADQKLGELTIGTATATGGVMTGLASILKLPEGNAATTTIALQFRVISPGWEGQTSVKQITLGPNDGPGTVVWGGTASATKFSSLLVTQVPEPSTIALGVLGLGSLLLFRRRK